MCLKKSVLKWHTNLSAFVKKKMNVNFRIWKNELLRKYRFNRFVFWKKAKNLVFRFDDSLTFNQYFFQKTNLLHDVEITEKNMMIQYLWNEFEFHLQTTISRKKNGDFLKNFEKRVQQNKIAIRRVHELNKKIDTKNHIKIVTKNLLLKIIKNFFFETKNAKSFSLNESTNFWKNLSKMISFSFESKKSKSLYLKIFFRRRRKNDRRFFDRADDATIFIEIMIVRKKKSEKKRKKYYKTSLKKKTTISFLMTKTKKRMKHFKKWFIASNSISIQIRKTNFKFVVFRWRICSIVN